MRRSNWAVVLALLSLVGLSARAQQETWTIYLRRAGPIRFGMTLAEVRQALRDPTASLDLSNGASESCAYLQSKSLPKDITLMFSDGRIVRIDVRNPALARTASGVRLGDSEDRVKRIYGKRIQVEPDKYDPDGHNLIFVPVDAADDGYRILFETDGKKVGGIRAGFSEPVGYVEGCS